MSILTVVQEVNKKFKSEVIFQGRVKYEQSKNKLKFTSCRLNYMLYGGLPRGKLIEFAGEENSGKTTTALDAVGNAQVLFAQEYEDELKAFEEIPKRNKSQEEAYKHLKARGPLKCLFVDCENTLDEDWAELLGVNVDELWVVKPTNQTAEQVFDIVQNLLETGEFGLAVLDSLAVLISQDVYEESNEKRSYGGISIPLTRFTKQLVQICSRFNTTFIGINQLRDKINSPMGGKDTTGGRAWKHNAIVRLFFSKGNFFDENGKDLTRNTESPAGNYVLINMPKTKACRPDRRVGSYTLNYTFGIDWVSDLVDLAIKLGYIDQSGAWFRFVSKDGEILTDVDGEEIKLQGRQSVVEFLEAEENLDFLQDLDDDIAKVISSNVR